MNSEQITNQAKDLLDNFNRIDETTQDKLLNGIKCLAFLQNLADIKDTENAPLKSAVS